MVIHRLLCCAKTVGGHSNNGAAAVAVVAVGSVTPNWFMNKLLLPKQMRHNDVMSTIRLFLFVVVAVVVAVVALVLLFLSYR